METRLKYQTLLKDILKNILLGCTQSQPASNRLEYRILFDDKRDGYALLEFGWEGDEYMYGIVIHVELIDEKIWIQCDGTKEVATNLLAAGVPEEQIVFGFH